MDAVETDRSRRAVGAGTATARPTRPARWDLPGSTLSVRVADDIVTGWAHERALPWTAVGRIALVTSQAVAHGQDLRAGGLTLRVGWADADHVRVDLEWHAPRRKRRKRRKHRADQAPDDAILATLDAFCAAWGPAEPATTPVRWFVVDTREARSA